MFWPPGPQKTSKSDELSAKIKVFVFCPRAFKNRDPKAPKRAPREAKLALKSAAKPKDFTFSLKNIVFFETKWLLRRCFGPRGLKKPQKVMNCQQKSRFSFFPKGVQKQRPQNLQKELPGRPT